MKVDSNLIKKLYFQGESTHTIAKLLNISHSTVMWHTKKLNISLRTKSEANKLAFKIGRLKVNKHLIPESSRFLTKEKAYILGVLCGDGYVSFYPNIGTYQICLQTVDKEFADEFDSCLQKVYVIKPYRKKIIVNKANWNDKFEVRLCSKEACSDILSIGSFKTKIWFVPKIIKESSLQTQASFLKGIFDSEGSVETNGKRINLTSTNLKGLKEIESLLCNFDIKSKINKQTRASNLRIQDKNSIDNFKQNIGFTIKRKMSRL